VPTHDQRTLPFVKSRVLISRRDHRFRSLRYSLAAGVQVEWQKGHAVKKERKNYSPQEKVAILRRHLLDKVPASLLCDQFQLQSKIFYGWLKQLFDNGPAALERRPTASKRPDAHQLRIDIFHEELGPCESRDAEQKWMISLMQGKFDSEEARRAIGDVLAVIRKRRFSNFGRPAHFHG
jgi:transposase